MSDTFEKWADAQGLWADEEIIQLARDAWNAGKDSAVQVVVSEAEFRQLSLQYCSDWPTEVYHPNDLRGFYEAGFRKAAEMRAVMKDDL